MAKLTKTQIKLLTALGAGRVIAYSLDGECGWLAGSNDILDDRDIWALRKRQYIMRESHEREDNYERDVITDAGRAALSEANAAPIPPHDPSGVISDTLSSGDSEMQGRLPRGEEFVPDERGGTA